MVLRCTLGVIDRQDLLTSYDGCQVRSPAELFALTSPAPMTSLSHSSVCNARAELAEDKLALKQAMCCSPITVMMAKIRLTHVRPVPLSMPRSVLPAGEKGPGSEATLF